MIRLLNKKQIHTQGIEGIWKHAKAHLKAGGGTLETHIQERLDEFIFHRTYLRDKPLNVWIMLRLLAKYGNKAAKFVDKDKGISKLSEKQKRKRINYRAEYIEDSDDESDVKHDELNMKEFKKWMVNEEGDLVKMDREGDPEKIYYADPDKHKQKDPPISNGIPSRCRWISAAEELRNIDAAGAEQLNRTALDLGTLDPAFIARIKARTFDFDDPSSD